MIKVDKFECTLENDRNLVFTDGVFTPRFKLDVDVLYFNDGSIRVNIPNINEIPNTVKQLNVVSYMQSMDDLMVVSQVLDIVKRHFRYVQSNLVITSPMYSRYDRVMLDGETDSFGSLVFSKFVNSIGYNTVQLVDNHSDVLLSLIDHSYDYEQGNILSSFNIGFATHNIIAPDKGALKKNPLPNIAFNKVRNLETGKITGMEMLFSKGVDLTKRFLVVDDLCEGGGTFLGLYDKFKEFYTNEEVDLYVTHGLFTNGAVHKLLEKYSNIYVYIMKESKYNELSDEQKLHLTVAYLVKNTVTE